MAPEHYLGQSGPAGDVFGLGTILWEMLAGRPFRGSISEGPALIEAVVKGVVEPVGRDLPAELERLLAGMLEPDASSRMSLKEVQRAIKDYPDRSEEMGEMVSVYFGRAGRRTGLSQAHFAASKELVDTIAVAKVAGVSLSKVQQRRVAGQPEDIPTDYTAAEVPQTSPVDPLAVIEALDDDLDDDLDDRRDAPRSRSRSSSSQESQPLERQHQEPSRASGAFANTSQTAAGIASGEWSGPRHTQRSPKSGEVELSREPTMRLGVEIAHTLVSSQREPDAPQPQTERLPPPESSTGPRRSSSSWSSVTTQPSMSNDVAAGSRPNICSSGSTLIADTVTP